MSSFEYPGLDFTQIEKIKLGDEKKQFIVLEKENPQLWTFEKHPILKSSLNAFFEKIADIEIVQEKENFPCLTETFIFELENKNQQKILFSLGKKDENFSCLKLQQKNKTQFFLVQDALSLKAINDLYSTDLDSWLDKNLLHLNPEKIQSIALFYEKDSLHLFKKGENWYLDADEQNPLSKATTQPYLAFFQKIFFDKPYNAYFEENFKIGKTAIAKLEIQIDAKAIDFVFYPLYDLSENQIHPFYALGIFEEKKYIFNYFHLDLWLKDKNFFSE